MCRGRKVSIREMIETFLGGEEKINLLFNGKINVVYPAPLG